MKPIKTSTLDNFMQETLLFCDSHETQCLATFKKQTKAMSTHLFTFIPTIYFPSPFEILELVTFVKPSYGLL